MATKVKTHRTLFVVIISILVAVTILVLFVYKNFDAKKPTNNDQTQLTGNDKELILTQLEEVVGKAVTDSGLEPREGFGPYKFYKEGVKVSNNWFIGNINSEPINTSQESSISPWDSYYIVGKYDASKGWVVAIAGQGDYISIIDEMPSSFLTPEAKEVFKQSAGGAVY
jgi:hypothetical protein